MTSSENRKLRERSGCDRAGLRKVAIIVGTRPQIIKSAPVFKAFQGTGVDCAIINTGQHYDYEMNRSFFEELHLPEPETNLAVGQGSPSEQVAGIIKGLGAHFSKMKKPDLALIPGDTNSALAAGIAASKEGIPIAHLESGCRSGDFRMSEEVNRRVLDHISHVLFCPTQACVANLKAENVLAELVEWTGDTMYDSILQCMGSIEKSDAIRRYELRGGGYAFMTLHRAETVDDPAALASMLSAVDSIGFPVVFSVHPRTRSKLRQESASRCTNIRFIEPLPYFDALKLVRGSAFVITDSGGLQKEAFWLGKPTLVTREVTEWIELVQEGRSFLVGTDRLRLLEGYRRIQDLALGSSFLKPPAIFGDGHAADKVVASAAVYLERRASSSVTAANAATTSPLSGLTSKEQGAGEDPGDGGRERQKVASFEFAA
jgi:UDP-GlcNAc3NAcA epimerase